MDEVTESESEEPLVPFAMDENSSHPPSESGDDE